MPFGARLAILLGIAVAGSLLGKVANDFFHRSAKSSEPYQRGFAIARESAIVKSRLGEPVLEGEGPYGSLKTHDGGGSAEFDFIVRGPRGEARVRLSAVRAAEVWTVRSVRAHFESGEENELVEPAGPR